MIVLQMLEPLLGFVGELICHFFADRVAEEAVESWYRDRHSSDL